MQKFREPEEDGKQPPEELDEYAGLLKKEIDLRFTDIVNDPLFIAAAFLDPEYKLVWCRKDANKSSEVKALMLDLMEKSRY